MAPTLHGEARERQIVHGKRFFNDNKSYQRHFVGNRYLFALIFVSLAFIIAISIYSYHYKTRQRFFDDKRVELSGIVDLKVKHINDWLNERKGDAHFIMNNKEIVSQASQFFAEPRNPKVADELSVWMTAMLRNNHYRQITLANLEGKAVFCRGGSVCEDIDSQFLKSASDRKVTICDFRLSSRDNPQLSLVVPLIDQNLPEPHVGYIHLVIDPENKFYELLEQWSNPSASAEVLLVRREGNKVVYLNNLRHRSNTALRLSLPLTNKELPAAAAVTGTEGIFEGLDYRNIPVLAAIRRFPGTPWFLIAKIDQEEIYQDLTQRSSYLLILLLFAFSLAALVSWNVVQNRQIKAERERSEFMKRFEFLLQFANDAIFLLDSELRIIEANHKAIELYGYSIDELLKMSQYDLRSPGARAEVEKLKESIDESGKTVREAAHRKKDGRLFPVEISSRRLNMSGRIVYQNIVRDISDRQKAEEQLRKLERAVDQSSTSIVITNAAGEIEYVNKRFTEITGYAPEEVIGQNPRILKSGLTQNDVYDSLWATISQGSEWRGELVNKKKSGELFTENVIISPIHSQDGQVTHFIAVKEDITERKKFEAQFLRSQRMESVGTLAGGIAHDLNNVLAPILTSAEMLKLRLTDGLLAGLVSTIEKSALRGSAIIKQVLSFARGNEGEPVRVQPQHALKEIELFINETFPRSIKIETNIAKDLYAVKADITQLHQVLMNLCVNARDAMPSGGTLQLGAENITVSKPRLGTSKGHSTGKYVRMYVSDTGIGIPPEYLDKIFDPFFTTKEVGKGTGLGLSTSFSIIQKHHGFIDVQSEPGKGSIFSIYLPCDLETCEIESQNVQTAVSGNHETILLVDDEATIRNSISEILTEYGFDVEVASSGEEGLRIYRSHLHKIDIVITDWMMPGMDGESLVREILKLNPDAKIIVSTGVLEKSEMEFKSSGISGTILKPFSVRSLLSLIHTLLPSSRITAD